MSEGLLLVVDRRDALLSYEAGALRLQQPDGSFARYPLELLGCVVVHGSPSVRCDVWRQLARREIPAVLLPSRGSDGAAWVGAGLAVSVRLRRLQHGASPARALVLARALLEAKITAQQALLTALADADLPALRTPRPVAGDALEVMARSGRELAAAADGEVLMGLEGRAAAAWYGWLQHALHPRWGFGGRNRRPPRDPLNALLSLGYTLLGAEVRGAVLTAGLDPSLGFLHQPYPGREALVLDCLEPLRPGVDALVLGLLDSELAPEHFTFGEEQGCRLSKAGRERFYPAWAAARRRWPQPGESREELPSLAASARRVVEGVTAQLAGDADAAARDG